MKLLYSRIISNLGARLFLLLAADLFVFFLLFRENYPTVLPIILIPVVFRPTSLSTLSVVFPNCFCAIGRPITWFFLTWTTFYNLSHVQLCTIVTRRVKISLFSCQCKDLLPQSLNCVLGTFQGRLHFILLVVRFLTEKSFLQFLKTSQQTFSLLLFNLNKSFNLHKL